MDQEPKDAALRRGGGCHKQPFHTGDRRVYRLSSRETRSVRRSAKRGGKGKIDFNDGEVPVIQEHRMACRFAGSFPIISQIDKRTSELPEAQGKQARTLTASSRTGQHPDVWGSFHPYRVESKEALASQR